mgnify:CR=1 FL=1
MNKRFSLQLVTEDCVLFTQKRYALYYQLLLTVVTPCAASASAWGDDSPHVIDA